MANNRITETVAALAKPIVEGLGFELVDVEYVREGSNWYLRVYIDKEGGITLDDCEAVNGPLGDKLDEVDPIPQSYIFEVSSPGVERPFKTDRDYEKAIGHRVKVKFFKAVDGRKTIEGVLEAFDGKSITVLTDDSNKNIYPLESISKINRVILF